MVFGWGKKKKQEPETVKQDAVSNEIQLSDVMPILDDIKNIRMKTIAAQVKTFRNKIDSECKRVLEIANELDADNLKVDDIDIHLKILVVRGKKDVVSTIKKECDVNFPQIESYDDVVAFSKIANRMLKRLGDVLGKHSSVIHIFAKKYAQKLKDDLSELNENFDDVKLLIENFSNVESAAQEIDSKINSYHQTVQLIQKQTKTISELTGTVSELDSKITDTSERIESIKSSQDYLEFIKISEKIDSLLPEKSKIVSVIQDQFTKISRPLNKFLNASSLGKEQFLILQTLSQSPFDALTAQNQSTIKELLDSITTGVTSGSVSVKDIDKSVSQIKETQSLIDSFTKSVTEFNEKKSDLEKQLGQFDNSELHLKEKELEKHSENKSFSESKITKLNAQISELKQELPEIISYIEKHLGKISAVQYEIKRETQDAV